jgi:hypothetical protein
MPSISEAKIKVGRPRLSEAEKKSRLSLTLSKQTLLTIDSLRGQTPRSTFVEVLLSTQGHKTADAREFIKKTGAVYTPTILAEYLAWKVVCLLVEDLRKESRQFNSEFVKQLRIIDPACGNGELLGAIWGQLVSKLRLESGATLDPRDVLCGVEINDRAAAAAALRINSLAISSGIVSKRDPKIVATNALLPWEATTSMQGWNRLKKQVSACEGFDVVIANPPWGADISDYKSKLKNSQYSLLQGQYDSSDLFVELALSITRPNGFLAYIIPDSLFNLERSHLRKLLLEKTHIRYVARLGEKIFDDVSRGCALIVCQNKAPQKAAKAQCLRLTPESRKRVLEGASTFKKEEAALAHDVPQSRFLGNPGYSFDIDLNVAEERVLSQVSVGQDSFGKYLLSTRGVELSKTGMVCNCPACGKWSPLPSAPLSLCGHCGEKISDAAKKAISIVRNKPVSKAVSFIVGESVGRYQLNRELWILSGYDGINYKDSGTYAGPKLLVRKTGVGISAAIDYTDAYTNQVVYIFRHHADAEAKEIPLVFFLALLNSRAMYYFLAKRHGETEWRSHPYLTQTQILSLPVPARNTLRQNIDSIQGLCARLEPHVKKGIELPGKLDAYVERTIADILGLNKKDYESIYGMLDSVQELLPVRKLKQVKCSEIFG